MESDAAAASARFTGLSPSVPAFEAICMIVPATQFVAVPDSAAPDPVWKPAVGAASIGSL